MPLMRLQLLRSSLPLHDYIALGPRIVEDHGLSEDLKALDVLDGLSCSFLVFEDDERLAFALQGLLRDNVDDRAIFAEKLAKSLDKVCGVDALSEVLDLYANC